MKLKCDAHNRRVLSSKNSFLHRTGDMSVCSSKTASMKDTTSHITRTYILSGTGGVLAFATDKVSRPHTKRRKE